MPAITLEQANAQLTAYLAAETKVLLGQAATLDDRSITLADLKSIQAGVKLWTDRVNELSQRALGNKRCRTVSPRW